MQRILQEVIIVILFITTTTIANNVLIHFPFLKSIYGPCITNDNQNGWCRDYQDCPIQDFDGVIKYPKLCGFHKDGYTPVICCPLKTDLISTNGNPAIVKLVEAPEIDFECGIQRHHKIEIFSGRNALPGEWPWMALFGRTLKNASTNYFCDGVLINERYVLTAAHCVLDPTPFFIRLGEHNFEVTTEDFVNPVDVEVEKVTVNPDYKLNQGHHDLALIKLANDVVFKRDIIPVCLPWGTLSNIDLVDRNVTVTGWGAQYFGGPSSAVPQVVDIQVFDSNECEKTYSTLSEFKLTFPEGMNSENTLCAGDKELGKDACQGDSGGPLVHMEDEKWILGGIISQGFGCGHKEFPGLYVPMKNVDYLQWIKDIAFTKKIIQSDSYDLF